MVVFQRVITWLAQRIIVQQLAQSPAFQRFAVRTTQMVQQQQARVQRAVRLSPTPRSAARCPRARHCLAPEIAPRLRSQVEQQMRESARAASGTRAAAAGAQRGASEARGGEAPRLTPEVLQRRVGVFFSALREEFDRDMGALDDGSKRARRK